MRKDYACMSDALHRRHSKSRWPHWQAALPPCVCHPAVTAAETGSGGLLWGPSATGGSPQGQRLSCHAFVAVFVPILLEYPACCVAHSFQQCTLLCSTWHDLQCNSTRWLTCCLQALFCHILSIALSHTTCLNKKCCKASTVV